MRSRIIIFIFLLVPTIAIANAGSTLIWFSFLHLIFINLLIGLIELLIYFANDIKTRKFSLVFSNYVSMFFGMYFIAPIFSNILGFNDFWRMDSRVSEYNNNEFFIAYLIAFIFTLIIEFPFHYFSVYKHYLKEEVNFKKFISVYLISNLATNILVFLLYLFLLL